VVNEKEKKKNINIKTHFKDGTSEEMELAMFKKLLEILGLFEDPILINKNNELIIN